MPKRTKSKGFYEPSGGEILASAGISGLIPIVVVIAGLVLIFMGLWYIAWIPIPIGLLVGLLITVIFRGQDEVATDERSYDKISDSYRGGRWSKEA